MCIVNHEAGTTIHIVSTFMVEMQTKQETSRSWKQASAGFLHGLHFDHEDVRDIFLRNIS
jgi:hypothetical protein